MKEVKLSITIFCILIGIWFGYAWGLDKGSGILKEVDVGQMITDSKQKYENSIEYTDVCETIRLALAETASKEYVKDEYNCVDFSKDLVRRLRGENIYANIVEGRTDEGRHMWIEVWLEPTSGYFVQYPNEYIEDK